MWFIAIIFPPLAVLISGFKPSRLIVSIILTSLLWIPGIIHAFIIINKNKKLKNKKLKNAKYFDCHLGEKLIAEVNTLRHLYEKGSKISEDSCVSIVDLSTKYNSLKKKGIDSVLEAWSKDNEKYLEKVKNFVVKKITDENKELFNRHTKDSKRIASFKETIKTEKKLKNEIINRHPFIKTMQNLQNRAT
jgi:uncharacterized membrane protein YqaE (UPF0057 family)|tara:strand:- start:14 stop:583 length:570 start_codon:yes stop_codon:yes gene_type:complete